jgi:hypothetical protein
MCTGESVHEHNYKLPTFYFCPMIQSGGRSYILIEFSIPMKLGRLIKMCLNETYSRVRLGKHLSDMSSIKNGLKQRDGLSP